MNVHTHLTPDQTAQLLRTAAVFRIPAGKTRRDVVVRKAGKGARLQLAKKSTGGGISAAHAREGDGLPELRGRRRRRRKVDKAVQCNLLSPQLPPPLNEAASYPHSLTATQRPQYARKSTSNASVATEDGLQLERRDACPVVEKTGVYYPHSLADTYPLRPQYARKSTSIASVATGGALESHPAVVERSGVALCQPTAGEPCEIMYKLGGWDVIFYEIPPIPRPHPPSPPFFHPHQSAPTPHVMDKS